MKQRRKEKKRPKGVRLSLFIVFYGVINGQENTKHNRCKDTKSNSQCYINLPFKQRDYKGKIDKM